MNEVSIQKRYVVYCLKGLLSGDNLVLEPVEFAGVSNYFETEQEAINTIVRLNMSYQDFVVLPNVYVTT